jgi:hypothetical protein
MMVSYMQDDSRFVYRDAFPFHPVDQVTGTIYIRDQKHFFIDQMQIRAPGDPSPRGGFKYSTTTYKCLQYSWAWNLPDEVRANADAPLQLERDGAEYLASMVNIHLERHFSSSFMTTNVWTTDVTGTTTVPKWSAANGDPVKDIRTYKRTVNQLVGDVPNTLIMGEIVWDKLVLHGDVMERIKYVQAATDVALEQAVGGILGVQPRVSYAIYNTADEGQTASMSPCIDDDALLFVRRPTGIGGLNAGVNFVWSEVGGLGQTDGWYEDDESQEVYRVKINYDMKALVASCAAFFSDIVD